MGCPLFRAPMHQKNLPWLAPFFLFFYGSLEMMGGKIIYQEKIPKPTIKKVVFHPQNLSISDKKSLYVLSFEMCKDRTQISWAHAGFPLVVCIPEESQMAYIWIEVEKMHPKIEGFPQWMAEKMKPLAFFLKNGHNLIFPAPRKREKYPYFFSKAPSPKFFNKAGKQDVFQRVSPNVLKKEFSLHFQKALKRLAMAFDHKKKPPRASKKREPTKHAKKTFSSKKTGEKDSKKKKFGMLKKADFPKGPTKKEKQINPPKKIKYRAIPASFEEEKESIAAKISPKKSMMPSSTQPKKEKQINPPKKIKYRPIPAFFEEEKESIAAKISPKKAKMPPSTQPKKAQKINGKSHLLLPGLLSAYGIYAFAKGKNAKKEGEEGKDFETIEEEEKPLK